MSLPLDELFAAQRWDRHFLKLALCHAEMSKDPSTKVGAVIIGPDREIRSAGFNGFPRYVADSQERLHDRELKLKLMVHAEMNAILAAAMVGIPLQHCTMYIAAMDKDGKAWGGNPCTRCTVELIQTGITQIISLPISTTPSRWTDDLNFARRLLVEVGIDYQEVQL
jgi:dCMP deaminase